MKPCQFKKLLITSLAVLLLGGIVAIAAFNEIGLTYQVGSDRVVPAPDSASVPSAVAENAAALAKNLFASNVKKREVFTSQLLATYVEARDKDLVVFFNPGGLGWTALEDSPQWMSIYQGVDDVLSGIGYRSLWLNYERTEHSLAGYFNEVAAIFDSYSAKAEQLSGRIKFLVDNLPDLKVIIAGESNGAALTLRAMKSLLDNPRVFSIQTGPPFWHRDRVMDRALVLTHNGIAPDSFSNGDIRAMIVGTFRAMLGIRQPEDDKGNIMYYVRAPGHDYQWRYPGVGSVITDFLLRNLKK